MVEADPTRSPLHIKQLLGFDFFLVHACVYEVAIHGAWVKERDHPSTAHETGEGDELQPWSGRASQPAQSRGHPESAPGAVTACMYVCLCASASVHVSVSVYEYVHVYVYVHVLVYVCVYGPLEANLALSGANLNQSGLPGAIRANLGVSGANLDQSGAPGTNLDQSGPPGTNLGQSGPPGANLGQSGPPETNLGQSEPIWGPPGANLGQSGPSGADLALSGAPANKKLDKNTTI